jgi:hypothetical protein
LSRRLITAVAAVLSLTGSVLVASAISTVVPEPSDFFFPPSD